MNDKLENFTSGAGLVAGIIFAAVIFLAFALYGVWAAAFVGTHLWLWFIVPVFHVAALTMPQAFGISLLVSYWTYHFRPGVTDDREMKVRLMELVGLVLMPWITLLVGYICHAWWM